MNAFHFPQPGERTNTAAIPVPEEVLVNVLVLAWVGHCRSACEEGHCDNCANNIASLEAAQRCLPEAYSRMVDEWVEAQIGSLGKERRG